MQGTHHSYYLTNQTECISYQHTRYGGEVYQVILSHLSIIIKVTNRQYQNIVIVKILYILNLCK